MLPACASKDAVDYELFDLIHLLEQLAAFLRASSWKGEVPGASLHPFRPNSAEKQPGQGITCSRLRL